jgi:hypothetical protein
VGRTSRPIREVIVRRSTPQPKTYNIGFLIGPLFASTSIATMAALALVAMAAAVSRAQRAVDASGVGSLGVSNETVCRANSSEVVDVKVLTWYDSKDEPFFVATLSSASPSASSARIASAFQQAVEENASGPWKRGRDDETVVPYVSASGFGLDSRSAFHQHVRC